MIRSVVFVCLRLLTAPCAAAAQQLEFPAAAVDDPALLAKTMPGLAEAVLTNYREGDRRKYLDTAFRLQMVAGQYDDATRTLKELRDLNPSTVSPQPGATLVLYEVLSRANVQQGRDHLAFDDALQRAFREKVTPLDDQTSALVLRALTLVSQPALDQTVHDDLQQQKGKAAISLADARSLVRDYQVAEAFRSLSPSAEKLAGEDDARRYVIDKDVAVGMRDGAIVCAVVVRPSGASTRLPTLLEFTIYADGAGNVAEARRAASHGYAGVVGLTRGKGCSPDKPVPYVHDGSDAAALIDWIASQTWSNGRVGMYGGSYSGFTPWAAAKHSPKALRAIMVGAPQAPGADSPMEGDVFWNFLYPWPFYTTDNKSLDNATYNESARWNRLNHDWYVSGRAYRDLDKIDGTPNPIFDEWLSHPTYDAYWQRMIPYKQEFAAIDIPVLTTAGYYYGGPGAAVYYMSQHYKYDPKAEHYLLIGPYDHFQAQRGTTGLLSGSSTVLAGYRLDPVAQIDLGELRYRWFDYALRGGPKPAILQDRVNYQVTGANVWKHAPTFAAMSDRTLRYHFSTARVGDAYRLSGLQPAGGASVSQTIDFADRSDADTATPGGGVLDKALDTSNGLEFVSDPLIRATELSGLFSGRLDFVTNKKDFDFQIALYELTSMGEYVQLAPYWSRASNVADIARRQLLTPGKRERLEFQSIRLMSRLLQPGSRVVAVLSIIKEPGRQINYGSGKDVSDETIADAKPPLTIKWFTDSYIEIPAR
jgi:putative CocE/NonD family hydrolase